MIHRNQDRVQKGITVHLDRLTLDLAFKDNTSRLSVRAPVFHVINTTTAHSARCRLSDHSARKVMSVSWALKSVCQTITSKEDFATRATIALVAKNSHVLRVLLVL